MPGKNEPANGTRSSTARFVATALVLYALFMVPWPGLRPTYRAVFRGMGNTFFSRFWFWNESGVRFIDLYGIKPGDLAPGAPALATTDAFDTVLELRTRGAAEVGYLRTSARYVGYLPIALFSALVFATCAAWRRRLVAFGFGLLLVHAFILLRLTLTLLAGGFAADKAFAIFQPSEFWSGLLTRADSVLADNPTVSYVVPVSIWFVVALPAARQLISRESVVSCEAGRGRRVCEHCRNGNPVAAEFCAHCGQALR